MNMQVRDITEKEIDVFRDAGVVKLPGYVDHKTVSVILDALDEQLANPGKWFGNSGYKHDRCFALGNPVLRDYVLHPKMGENAAAAMGSATARFYFDHMFAFDPDTPIEQHYWHQDQPFWPVEGEQIVSIWLSLTRCTPQSAALKFVPGTQQNKQMYRPKGFDGSALQSDLGERGNLALDVSGQWHPDTAPAFHENPELHGVVEWSYEPGDAVMFHTRTLHSSGGNRSATDRRVAYSIRYVGDDARLTLRRGVFQDPSLMPEDDEPFSIGGAMNSHKWPIVHPPSE